MALSDFLNGYTSVSLFTMFFMLTLGSTRKSCVAQKTVLSTKEIFHIEVKRCATKLCESQKHVVTTTKNYVTPKKDPC